ncbi:MAG: hypothetical protein ABIP35_11930 [Ginsengibacter sp.]
MGKKNQMHWITIKSLFILLAFLGVISAPAQNKTSKEKNDSKVHNEDKLLPIKELDRHAILITKKGDTLKCLARFPFPQRLEIEYLTVFKKNTDSIIIVKPSDIASVIGSLFWVDNMLVGGKEKLMLLVADGKIILYTYSKYYGYDYLNDYGVFYVAVKNNKNLEINRKTFKVLLRHLTFHYPELVKKIDKRGYEYDDIIKIVNEYNKRFR